MGKSYDWRPIEKERIEAFTSRDAVKYAELCYELGIEPEDRELYNQGAQAEFDFGKLERIVDENVKPLKKRKRSVSNMVYRNFYSEGENVSRSIFESIDTKKRLLLSHFPKRFGADGRNSVYNISPEKVGSLFNHMRNYAKRRIKE